MVMTLTPGPLQRTIAMESHCHVFSMECCNWRRTQNIGYIFIWNSQNLLFSGQQFTIYDLEPIVIDDES